MIVRTEWEKVTIGDFVGEAYTSDAPDWSIFSTSEMAVISSIKAKFEKFSARRIAEYSHIEKGYQETKDGEIISYSFAADLQI